MLSWGKAIAVGSVVLAFGAGLLVGGPDWGAVCGFTLLCVVAMIGWTIAARSDAQAQAQLHQLRRATSREQVLDDLGAALLASTEPGQVHRHAARAADTLLQDYPGARAAVLSVVPDLPEPGSVVLPLVAGERERGVLTITAPGDLPPDLIGALQAVQTQAALALDSALLAEELQNGAVRDPLTGVGNRALVRERLTTALSRARRSNRPVAVLLLDLAGFKQVNDVHGHDAGDELLRVVAGRIKECVRTEDVVGRLGGDQFAVVAEDLHTAQDIVVIAERIVSALESNVAVGGRVVRTPASVGIALSHPDTTGPDEVLRAAEAAMSAAKQLGGARYQLHGAPSLT